MTFPNAVGGLVVLDDDDVRRAIAWVHREAGTGTAEILEALGLSEYERAMPDRPSGISHDTHTPDRLCRPVGPLSFGIAGF